MFVPLIFHCSYTFLQQFLAVGLAFTLSGILTAAGVFSDDPKDVSYRARTDSRIDIVTQASVIYFPYPCEYIIM